MTLTEYLDAARARCGLSSDLQLSFRLGHVSNSRVNRWRNGHHLPDWDEFIKLVDLAGVDRDRALIDRAAWQAAKEGQPAAAARLSALAARVLVTASLLLTLSFAGVSTACAAAAGAPARAGLYIMENLRRWRRCLSWQAAAALASLALVLAPTPVRAADCQAGTVAAAELMPRLTAEGYEIVSWFRLGTRKQAFLLANAVRDVVMLRVTLPAAPDPEARADLPAALPDGQVCVIWRGSDYMARMILPPVGTGL